LIDGALPLQNAPAVGCVPCHLRYQRDGSANAGFRRAVRDGAKGCLFQLLSHFEIRLRRGNVLAAYLFKSACLRLHPLRELLVRLFFGEC
jgi:hypothetical protein